MTSNTGWQIWVDRGGTFTDVVARRPDGTRVTAKLLSEAPECYEDAVLEAIRRLLGVRPEQPIPVEELAAVKIGTTLGTNALLERKGEPTVLFITRGFRDQLRIGYQDRPKLFERRIRLPELLYSAVVEVDERIGADGRVLVSLDEAGLSGALEAARARGFRACAIVFMHACVNPTHEERAAELARRAGFTQVSSSAEVNPLPKLVARGDTTVVDAYLSPVLRAYVERLERGLGHPSTKDNVPLYFMKSDGALARAAHFRGKDSILSGPAGGIVGMVQSSLAAGFEKVIGFDMGGTSTDVSHFAGKEFADCEREFDARVASVHVRAPMLGVHTIAAGGGSILEFDGQRYRVGPASAGANPGPACYRRGGPLTLTDCNVLLGRIVPEFFPRVFGPAGDEPLDREIVVEKFRQLAARVSESTGRAVTSEAVAEGFLRVASANMANAIEFISVKRGHDVTEYTLTCFGGAGGQHACLVADALGMERILIPAFAGVLSAFGLGVAEVGAIREQRVERALGEESWRELQDRIEGLRREAEREVMDQGVPAEALRGFARAHLKYEGTDSTLTVPVADEAKLRRAFEAAHQERFAFTMPERRIVIESLSVEVLGRRHSEPTSSRALLDGGPQIAAEPRRFIDLYTGGAWQEAPLFQREELAEAQRILGPAVIAESNATTLVDLGWSARVSGGDLILERSSPRVKGAERGGSAPDPVLLEVFNNLFMAIAERMGARLENSAYSVNIKERLDFSCALFDALGDLIANAPHMPVHLGSMGESVRAVLRKRGTGIRPGDVYALNDPYNGGTHLPDITVVMPVFLAGSGTPEFFVAARGHHADVGGITPGSMPPGSRSVEEEGVLFDDFLLVEDGRLREAELRNALVSARYPARNPDQNVADLTAQIAACEKGRAELLALIDHYGLDTVRAYMAHVQDNAEESVRRVIVALEDGEFETRLDDGARIHVRIRVDRVARAASVDFSGTSPELDSNFNAPPAVVHAAVLYVFRTLVDADIPMNAGCMRPLRVIIPEGSMLAPRPPRATVAGNVETSQCIVDALYGALGTMGAAQGTMNNFTIGDARYQYYETIAGGSGAGDGFDGCAAVQTHMTNSRLTDPEVIEARFPVIVEEHSIRAGSGGRGRYRGGDGALRRIRFLEPLHAAILAGRRTVAPYGMAGGGPGEMGRSWVERASGQREELGPTAEVLMHPGDVFVIQTPSGGGYGAEEPA